MLDVPSAGRRTKPVFPHQPEPAVFLDHNETDRDLEDGVPFR